MSNETKADAQRGTSKPDEKSLNLGGKRFYQNEMQFHQGVQLEGELLNSYSAKRNINYSVWFDPGLRIVIFLHKVSGNLFWTAVENVKSGKFERTSI